jgi:hypothetical protein
MDLIGSINYIENRLGGRKPNQEKGKPARKNTHDSNTVDEKIAPADSSLPPTEFDSRLGRKIDTTA